MKNVHISEIVQRTKEVLKKLRKEWRKVPVVALSFFDSLWDIIVEQEKDNDRRNKMEVYLNVGSFLGEMLSINTTEGLDIVCEMTGEEDDEIVSMVFKSSEENIKQAKELIKSIEVKYAGSDTSSYKRVTEILYSNDNETFKKKRFIEDLPWDRLPSNVRKERIEKRENEVIFKLYTMEV